MNKTTSSASAQQLAARTHPHKSAKRSRTPSSQPTERPTKRHRSFSPQHAERPKAPETEPPKNKQPVKFLIISDTHDDDDPTESDFQPPTTLPAVDVVLHCGDLTVNGTLTSLRRAIDKLASIPASLRLVIAGNHDLSLDPSYYASQTAAAGNDQMADEAATSTTPAAALALMTTYAATKGVTYLPEGTHTFTLPPSCATTTPTPTTLRIYASPWTPAYGQSAFQYPTAHDRFNPPATNATPPWATNVATPRSAIPAAGAVDVVMTHGPPQYVLDVTDDGRSAGCEHLRRAVARARPRLHAFGHVHRGYGAQRVVFGEGDGDGDGMECLPVEWVGRNQARRKGYAGLSPGSVEAMRRGEGQGVMVNAAVMDGEGRAGRAPWVVELEL